MNVTLIHNSNIVVPGEHPDKDLDGEEREPCPRWLREWTGRRFFPRFQLDPDAPNSNAQLVRSYPRAFWFDQTWTLMFPLHLESIPRHHPEKNDCSSGYVIHPPEDLQLAVDANLDQMDVATLTEMLTDKPFLVAELYTPTIIDPELHILHVLREDFMSSPRRKNLVQKTAVYALPELADVQKDYIGEFLCLMRDQVLAYQDEQFDEDHPDASSDDFDFRYDDLPLPSNPLLEKHVRKIVLDMTESTWYIIFCYDEENTTTSSDAPDAIEIMASVPLDDDDEPQPQDSNYISTKDGEDIVLYVFCLSRVR